MQHRLENEFGVPVELKHRCVSIKHEDKTVTSIVVRRNGDVMEHQVDGVLSTLPLKDLIRSLDPPPPQEVLDAADRLRYRDFCLVALMTTEAEPFPDNWIYIHDPGTRAGRVQNFGSWSEDMVVPGTTCLGVEYFCFEGDDIWEMSSEDAVEMAKNEMARIGLIDPDKVIDGVKVRVPKAYPMYDLAVRGGRRDDPRVSLAASRTCSHAAATACIATTTRITRCGRRSWPRSTSQRAWTTTCGRSTRRRSTSRRASSWTRCWTSTSFTRHAAVMSAGSEPTVTVVIGSNAPPESLAACLEALEPQRDGVEVLVQEGRPSPADLRDRFPWADFALAPDQLVPEHWRDGIDRASGEIVALTIAPMIPAPDWIATIRRLHAEHEAVGGAIEPGPRLRLVDWGEYFCRYARDMPPFEATGNVDLPGDNAAYDRALLEGVARDVSRRVLGAGRRTGAWPPTASCLWHDPALVVRQGRSAGFGAFARQRLAHGRRYGHQRGVHFSRSRNLVGVVAAPLVPVRDDAPRAAPRSSARAGYRGRALLALPAHLRLQRGLGVRRGARSRRRAAASDECSASSPSSSPR